MGAGSLLWQGGEFSTVSSFASFATLQIEDLHVQFKKPSIGQAGKKGKPLLIRKGNRVPLSLPAGGHLDLEWRINPAPACPSGRPAISHAPGSWHPERGREALSPPVLCANASRGAHFARPTCSLAWARAPEPSAFAFCRGCKSTSAAGGAQSCRLLRVPSPYQLLEHNSCMATKQTPWGRKMH